MSLDIDVEAAEEVRRIAARRRAHDGTTFAAAVGGRSPSSAGERRRRRRGRRAPNRPAEADAGSPAQNGPLDPPPAARKTVQRRVAARAGARGIISCYEAETQRFRAGAALVLLSAGLAAQEPQQPTFTVRIDAVNMDVIVKDSGGRFIPDLKKDEFEVYEDGVKQDVTSMTMSYGGRVTNVLEAPPPPTPEGILLPPRRGGATTRRDASSSSSSTISTCSSSSRGACGSCSRRFRSC